MTTTLVFYDYGVMTMTMVFYDFGVLTMTMVLFLFPVMLQTLRELSKNTSVMSKPEKLKEEVITLAMEDALGVDLKRAPTPT